MSHDTLKRKIINVIALRPSIKARDLSKILTEEFNEHIDRSTVNKILYQLRKEGEVVRNDSYEWELAERKSQNTEESIESVIQFTEDQEAVINMDPSNHLLIRGQAGSGKTTVLAARAGKILSAMNHGTILFLTYNSALCEYVRQSFVGTNDEKQIEVKTFHDWSRGTAKSLGFTFSGWVTTNNRRKKLESLIEEAKEENGDHRLYELEKSPYLLAWWGEEIAWLFGQHITRLADYKNVERVGRGQSVRLVKADRKYVWTVFELYSEWLEESNQEDYDNPAGLILRALMEKGGEFPDELKFDHVMVDEVQDFDKSWLLAVSKVPRVSLSLAGDVAQKIYKRNFTWVSVGIQVQGGRTRKLSASHRTTKQIMDVAEYLLKNNAIQSSEDYVNPAMPVKQGEKVSLLLGRNPVDAYTKGYKWIADNFKQKKSETIAIALPFSNQLYPAKKQLEKLKFKAELAKGANLGKIQEGAVVTTFHQLKGLEFDHVVIMGLHDNQYPGRILSNFSEEDHEEEINLMKRVLYVAMTRAKKSVTLVGSQPFCRFFKDIPDDLFIYL